MERGNSKHSRRLDEQLDAEARTWTHAGPGAGHADPARDIEPAADDDGILTGIYWLDHTDATSSPHPSTKPPEPDTTPLTRRHGERRPTDTER